MSALLKDYLQDYIEQSQKTNTQHITPEKKDDEVYCWYNEGVLCSMWRSPKTERACTKCGWNPEEEYRRKKRLEKLVEKGEWIPHLYSLEHYG